MGQLYSSSGGEVHAHGVPPYAEVADFTSCVEHA